MTFPKVTVQPSPDNRGINVVIEVVEGPSFDIGAIRLVGPIGDPKALYQTMVLEPGDLAIMTEVAAAVKRVRPIWFAKGT